MRLTLGAEALLNRVARGQTDTQDADQLRRWLFPDAQTELVKAYLVLLCNVEQAKTHIATDLRLNLALSLLDTPADALDTLFADAIDRYASHCNRHGCKPAEARAAAVADVLNELETKLTHMKEQTP